jgi:hypothetical protein
MKEMDIFMWKVALMVWLAVFMSTSAYLIGANRSFYTIDKVLLLLIAIVHTSGFMLVFPTIAENMLAINAIEEIDEISY